MAAHDASSRTPAAWAHDTSALFRALLERANEAIEIIDPASGRFLDVNRKACLELGYGREELLALTMADVNADPFWSFGETRDRLRASAALIQQTTRRRRDGGAIPVELNLTWVELDHPYIVSVARDVTERRRTEDALRASEDRLRAILESEPECVKLIAADGTLIDMNRAGLAMIEADTLGAVVGTDLTPLVRPDHREAFVDLAKRVFKGETGSLEFAIVGLRGTPLWLEMHATPLRDRDGRIIAALSVTRNVSDRVAAEETRRRLEDQLRQAQKMEAMGRLSGGIAHDFNNILTVIQGHAALLEAEPGLPAALVSQVREIAVSGQRAASLTRQLLAVSRRQPMQLRNLDVNELVTNMGRLLERIVGENITVQVDVGPAPLIVHADAGLIDQVLLNLAVNARDAMPHGGRLLIRATAESVAPADRPVTGSADSDEFVNIAVTDTGIGIPDDVLPHMFEPFFTTKDVGKGTGLGLSTAYAIVQQHDGWLDGQSRLGAGSTFTIHLPRQPERAESPSARDEAVAPAGGHETVLVVEDERPLRMLVSKVLTRAGYRVLEAATGPEALEVWRQHRDRIQVLLTDLVMPDAMSGLDLANRLREDDPNLVVVYTSGYSAEVAGASGQLQEGVNLLVKPYRPPELLRILRARLDQER